jgi:hypothetical protein
VLQGEVEGDLSFVHAWGSNKKGWQVDGYSRFFLGSLSGDDGG